MAEKVAKTVFISADMEGVSSLAASEEVSKGESDYEEFCKLMTGDVNAAVEGALEAGAGRVVVRDAHATARNILPAELHPRAELIRGWTGRPLSMMDGIDEGFDLVLFVGYHSGPGLEGGTLAHAMSGKFHEIHLNDRPASEAYLNALTAGYYKVPVGFISGDDVCCQQAQELIPGIETAVVKYGRGQAVHSLPLEEARQRIREGASRAVKNPDCFKLLGQGNEKFSLSLSYRRMKDAIRAGNYPGARQKNYLVEFSSQDYLEVLTFLHFVS